jgi:hypothetical protein
VGRISYPASSAGLKIQPTVVNAWPYVEPALAQNMVRHVWAERATPISARGRKTAASKFRENTRWLLA